MEEQREEPLLLEEVWDGTGGVRDVLGGGGGGVGVDVGMVGAADVCSACGIERVEVPESEAAGSEDVDAAALGLLGSLLSSMKLPSVNPHWQPHVSTVQSGSPPQSTSWRGKS